VTADALELGEVRRIAAAVGVGQEAAADAERGRPAHAVGQRAADQLGGAAADVDDADLAQRRVAERRGGAEERVPRLLLAAEDVDLDARLLLDAGQQLVAVGRLADRVGADRPDRLGAALAGQPHLLGDGAGHLGRLAGRDLALRAQAGERPLLHDLAEPPVGDLGDEQPGRVRPDVDAGAGHGSTVRPVQAPAILVRDLHKSYGPVEAVRGLDFEVARGEVFGLLGPNGAGKTTTVEVLEGYLHRTSGIVSVLGHDPEARPRELRERVGIVPQSGGVYRHLTVREAVAHWARLYPRPRDVDEVVELAGLSDQADVRTRRLSGGRQRRLDFALALVGDPELIFLDEPTTGFDPRPAGRPGRPCASSPTSARPSC
jgi:ABC-type branched-subunit amino acid transport system ATPase component